MTSVTVTTTENSVAISGATQSTVVTVPVTSVVSAITEGPQGPSGIDAGALPIGGEPGNVLIKQSSANYDADWIATLDGGTFN